MVHADKHKGDTLVGQTVHVDPDDYGVPEDALFSLYAFVVWGSDVQGHEVFRYQKGNGWSAKYALSGTTLDAHLSYKGRELNPPTG